MDKLIDYFGGRTQAATALGVTPSFLSMCRSGKRKFSPALAMLADKKTGGKISKEALRPDVYPPY